MFLAQDMSMRGEKNQMRCWQEFLDGQASIQSIHYGHCQIKHNNVGLKLLCVRDCFPAICRLGAYAPASYFEHTPQTLPDKGAVVGNEDALHITQIPPSIAYVSTLCTIIIARYPQTGNRVLTVR